MIFNMMQSNLLKVWKNEVFVSTTKTPFLFISSSSTIQFVLCEALNLAMLSIVAATTDRFLDGQFWGYGTRVWNYHQMPPERRATIANPMCSLFPTVTS